MIFSRKFRLIIILLCVCFLSFSTKGQAKQNAEVTLNVSVTDKKDRFVKNLTGSNFEIFNKNNKQKVSSVTQEDVPASIGILVDLSGSIEDVEFKKTQYIDIIKKGLTNFVKQSNPANEYFILGFNKQPKLLVDNTQDTSELFNAFEKLSEFELAGYTAFYDALYQSAEKVSEGKYEKRVLILITDGKDVSSKKDFGDVKEILKEKNLIVYSVGILDPQYSYTMLELQGQKFLEEFCKITGGWNLIPKKEEEINSAFVYIAEELRNQYQITFDLEGEKADREWHEIKIKLFGDKDLRKATIRTRQGFYVEKKGN